MTSNLIIFSLVREILGESHVARRLYEAAIRISPHNALAHAGLGLLLLGTGSRNYAAVNACGLNHVEAMKHLIFANNLDPSIKVTKALCY